MTVDFEGDFKGQASLTNNLNKILDLFDKYNASATFFVVGELIDKYPNIIKEIPKKHEIAAHGFRHRCLSKLNEDELKNEIGLSKKSILKIRKKCLGFRAPYNIIHPELGALLKQEGFIYDSSICRSFFPGRYYARGVSNYGYLASKGNLKKRGGDILEMPISSVSIFKLPFGLSFIKAFHPFYPLKSVKNNYLFYFHNYELDENPPKESLFFITKKLFKRKGGKEAYKILENILKNPEFKFISCKEFIKNKYPKLIKND